MAWIPAGGDYVEKPPACESCGKDARTLFKGKCLECLSEQDARQCNIIAERVVWFADPLNRLRFRYATI